MKKSILVSLLAVSSLAPLAAFASDGTITFTGEVTGQTCTINGGQPNFTKVLPKVSSSVLGAAGQTAGGINFPIQLTNCTPASGGARVFFETGPNVDTTSGRLNIATGSGQATNVQVQLLNSTGGAIVAGAASGSQNSGNYAPISSDGKATLYYGAQYYATGAATVGLVSTSVTYSIEYQ
jgi:major type 1 subunit fimbrin (pilin)